uniref:Uncharacterized protein LOC104219068 n=1 Tax=Nicotiana sylvestris TaxID=4096 RepID=A0A1U7W052_NICSY|nr:PREDICTED: uncharacterized protein LOC104219068 [Nicotiana sylvestris]
MAKTSKTVPLKEKDSSSSSRSTSDKAPALHEIFLGPCVTKNDFKVENHPLIPCRYEHVSRYICSITEKHLEAMKRDYGWGDQVVVQIPSPEESIEDISEMRPALPGEETESPIPKSVKDNKRKRVSKPEDPKDKRGPARRRKKNLIPVDIESVHQMNEEEEDEGEDSTLVVFTKFRVDLSQCEVELQKTLDERNALKLLCSQKEEEELRELRADFAKARKDEAELDKQGAKEKSLPHAKRIDELEVKLAEAKAEVGETKIAVDKTIVIYLAGAKADQTQLREASDRERQSNDFSKCQSRRETLEEIHTRGYNLSE